MNGYIETSNWTKSTDLYLYKPVSFFTDDIFGVILMGLFYPLHLYSITIGPCLDTIKSTIT